MKKIIRQFLQSFGYDIIRHKPPFVPGKLNKAELLQEQRWLQDYSFESVIDIGANEGQFSERMRIVFPKAKIYAFEPLPGVYARLKGNFAGDNLFEAFPLALGARPGKISFRENEYSPSSSMLELTDMHKQYFTEAVVEKQVEVSVETLDGVLGGKDLGNPYLVKMDVQGYEDQVMEGGEKILRGSSLVICELSFEELYKGQPLFADIYQRFRDWGFSYCGCIDQLYARDSHKPLQADGIFIKQS